VTGDMLLECMRCCMHTDIATQASSVRAFGPRLPPRFILTKAEVCVCVVCDVIAVMRVCCVM
jgi:hypothetical protein